MSRPSEWAQDAAHTMLAREGLDPDIQRGVRDRLHLAISAALDTAHAAGYRAGVEAAAKVCEAHADHQGANMTAGPMTLDARRTAATQITTARFLAGCCRALKPTEPA